MRASSQLALDGVLEHAFREHQRVLTRYIQTNKARYTQFARAITSNLDNPNDVWDRLAFAILSAHAPFDASVQALQYAASCRGHATPHALAQWQGMYPKKAKYLNTLPLGVGIGALLKNGDTWFDYRLRLQATVKGLGLAKASFAASLLYPLESDLACIDTHMQRVYLGTSSFHSLPLRAYLTVEGKVRRLGQETGVNTFLAQWLIWDCARGTVSDHAVFPGQHKDEAVPF